MDLLWPVFHQEAEQQPRVWPWGQRGQGWKPRTPLVSSGDLGQLSRLARPRSLYYEMGLFGGLNDLKAIKPQVSARHAVSLTEQ